MKSFFKSMERMMLLMALVVVLFFCATARAGDYKATSFNLQGDALYILGDNVFATGAGIDIGKFWTADGIAQIRAEWVVPVTDDDPQMVGIGLGVSIPKLFNKIGIQWLPEKINSSFGILGLLEMGASSPEIHAGLYLTVIKLEW